MDIQERRAKKRAYYQENRERILAKDAERRRANPELHYQRSRASIEKKKELYLEKNRARNRALRTSLREQAIQALGARCVLCGYDKDIRALTIDHIVSIGTKERKATHDYGYPLYKSVIANGGQGRYQCLCANCNQIKAIEMKEHPHR